MSTFYQSDYARAVQRQIIWDETRSIAAGLLATGHSQTYTAEQVGVHRNTIRNWLDDPEFAAEVDRLAVMTGVANRAERLRIVNRLVRQCVKEDGDIITEKDLLDWLKFAQSETDGAKIDLSKLAEMLAGESGAQQGDGPSGLGGPAQLAAGAIEVEATSGSDQSGSLAQDVVGRGGEEALNPS